MLGDYPEISPEERVFWSDCQKARYIAENLFCRGILVYEYKWKVFGEWCRSKQLDHGKTIVPQLSEFLTFLFEVKHLICFLYYMLQILYIQDFRFQGN